LRSLLLPQDAETARLRGALGGAILSEKPNVKARVWQRGLPRDASATRTRAQTLRRPP
jgi:hypothetical protein